MIGLKDKDKFNASKPKDDAQFLDYVTNPTLPALLGLVLTGNAAGLAPTNLPRTDLVTVFLTGITGVNKPATVTPSEMLRLNTAIAPVPFASQNRLAIVGSLKTSPAGTDFAGFPNGRRPKDDVVDIALVAMLGGLCMANGNTDALKLNSAARIDVRLRASERAGWRDIAGRARRGGPGGGAVPARLSVPEYPAAGIAITGPKERP